MSNQQRKKNPSAFLRNIFQILQNSQLNQIIEWAPQGNGFVIKNLADFQISILPQYFKHKKYSSFVRQLNMYGFHKQRNSSFQNCFLHQQFRRGDELPLDIKRKPEKKKKLNEQSGQNIPKSSDWLLIGQQLRQHFPQMAENILIKHEKQIKKTIVITGENKKPDQNIESQKIVAQEQQDEYVSKISLKGFIQQLQENPQQSRQDSDHIQNEKIQNEQNQEDSEQFQQESMGNSQKSESNQYDQSKQSSSLKQSARETEKKVQSKFFDQEKQFSHCSLKLNISENTLESLTGLSQILIRQNEILRKTHPFIRNMILQSQQNKIDYLNEELNQFDEKQSKHKVNSKLTKIFDNQKYSLMQLANILEKQIQNLAQFTINEEFNPISTTSIRLGLEKTQ